MWPDRHTTVIVAVVLDSTVTERTLDLDVICRAVHRLTEYTITRCDGSTGQVWEVSSQLDWLQPVTGALSPDPVRGMHAERISARTAFAALNDPPLVTVDEGAALLDVNKPALAQAIARARRSDIASESTSRPPETIFVTRRRAHLYWPPQLRMFWAGRRGPGRPPTHR
jgi:hypothetical protein